MKRATTENYTQDDINQAIGTILTAEVLDNQTMRAVAQQSTLDELYGFGYDYRKTLEKRLRAMTPEDLHNVAVKYLSGAAVTTVTTPQPAVVDPEGAHTEKAAPVRRSGTEPPPGPAPTGSEE